MQAKFDHYEVFRAKILIVKYYSITLDLKNIKNSYLFI